MGLRNFYRLPFRELLQGNWQTLGGLRDGRAINKDGKHRYATAKGSLDFESYLVILIVETAAALTANNRIPTSSDHGNKRVAR